MQNERLNLGVLLRCTGRLIVVGAAFVLLALTDPAWAMKAQPAAMRALGSSMGRSADGPRGLRVLQRNRADVPRRHSATGRVCFTPYKVSRRLDFKRIRLKALGDRRCIHRASGGGFSDRRDTESKAHVWRTAVDLGARWGAAVNDTVHMAVPAVRSSRSACICRAQRKGAPARFTPKAGGRAINRCRAFDLAVRDPADPRRLRAAYDSGDHLHMNDAGYEAMAQAFDLAIFKLSSVLCSADRANMRQRRDAPGH
jgi:hypothetical protein